MKQTVASNTTAVVTATSLMQLRVQWPVVQVVLHLAANHLDFLCLPSWPTRLTARGSGADQGFACFL